MRAPRMPSVTVKRRVVAACVTVDFAGLGLLAAKAWMFHDRAPLAAVGTLLVGAVCGLNYLRSTRGRS